MKLLTLTITLSSAHADPKTDILGKWTDSETGQVTEYKERGKVEQTLPSGEILRGRYGFVDEGQLYIQFASELMPVSPVITPITIKGDDLQLVDSDGKKVKKFKRKKEAKEGE